MGMSGNLCLVTTVVQEAVTAPYRGSVLQIYIRSFQNLLIQDKNSELYPHKESQGIYPHVYLFIIYYFTFIARPPPECSG